MNGGEHSERPSGFLLGREFIIVLVVIFSGLSFTLGYFVGKNTVDPGAAAPLQAAEGTVQQNPKESPPCPSDQTADIAQMGSSLQTVRDVAAEPVSIAAMQSKHNRNAVPVSHEQEEPAAQPKEERKAASDTAARKTVVAPVAETAADENAIIYSVQIGAFKNAADAKHLKTLFEKKGYKPFILQSKDPKGRRIYKVKTGEFRDKKDAEMLALRLEKTEELSTYVTPRAE